ncbi:MAG: hypothetical protein IJD68_02720 [Ruminococcus sp.]|nr:hypothetical protein [Ruminococcus sp.]
MKKRIVLNIFFVTFLVSLLFVSIIALTEYLTTQNLTHVWVYISVVLFIPVVVTLSIRHIVTKKIIKPINNIDIENPKADDVHAEFSPLISKIESQNTRILKQMEQLNAEHQSRDKLRREFTANVSHELKTPLTSISGYAEIIRDGIARPEDTVRFAGKIYDESQRLITLVQDIIKLSSLEGSDIEINFESIKLYPLCESVISRLEAIAKKRDISFELTGDNCEISGVPNVVEEMIYNLCDNAVKYNKDGGKVIICIKQFVDGVELSVKDSGIGIPQSELTRIFERFYRVNKSHSKEIGGTGLGLSIVKHGAILHNASISVDSKLDKGTTIKILF